MFDKGNIIVRNSFFVSRKVVRRGRKHHDGSYLPKCKVFLDHVLESLVFADFSDK